MYVSRKPTGKKYLWFLICPWLRLLAFSVLLITTLGCTPNAEQREDYTLGIAAMQERDIAEAQMHFERYLRLNPEGALRWEAWQKLLDIALNYRHEKSTAYSYLEVMLLEYEANPERSAGIKMQLAYLNNQMRNYDNAVMLWESLLEGGGLTPKAQSLVLRDLSKAYLRRMEFTQSISMLRRCMALEIPDSIKAECLYDLAETSTITEDQETAVNSLMEILDMPGAADKTKVLATFLLADVLEQTGEFNESLRLFESLQGQYPNEKVIAMRIENLRKKK